MNRKQRLAVFTFALIVAAGSAVASEIYRYTDANGEIHYVDRPTGAPSEERVAISSKPTNPAQAQARAAQRYATDPSAGATEEDRQEETKSRAERAAEAKETEQKCQQYRDQLESYVTSRRLYREDENGERVYLDEAERQEARSKVEELIVENCN
jgi:hypothetical protein